MNSDPDFRAARKAGARGVGGVISLLIFLAVVGFMAQPSLFFGGSEQTGASGPPPVFLGVLGLLGAIALLMLFIDVRRRVRRGSVWGRAARGAASLTLRGQAVAKKRNVSGRPMRTVVVEHGGERRYLHLLFAKDAPTDAMRQGPVTVELFAGDGVEGPARILLPDGRTLWAFTSRLGARPPVDRRAGTRDGVGSTADAGAGGIVPGAVVGAYVVSDDDLDRNREEPRPDDGFGDGAGDVTGESAWSGGDGWTGGGSWGGDSTWTGSDGGSGGWGGTGDSGGGWSGGGGDSGGGGGGGGS